MKFRTVREQTVVEHERQILKQTAEGAKVMPQEHISERKVEQCEELCVSLSGQENGEVAQGILWRCQSLRF